MVRQTPKVLRRIILLTTQARLLSAETTSAVSSALLVSHGIRKDAMIHVVTNDRAITFDGGTARLVRPDHQSLLGFLTKALLRGIEAGRIASGVTVEPFSGEDSFRPTKRRTVYYSAAKGTDIRSSQIKGKEIVFITGSRELLSANNKVLMESGASPLRVSKVEIPPYHQIVLFNAEVDRQES